MGQRALARGWRWRNACTLGDGAQKRDEASPIPKKAEREGEASKRRRSSARRALRRGARERVNHLLELVCSEERPDA